MRRGTMLQKLNRYAKAVAAALVAGYAIYQTAKGASSPAGVGITFNEWVDIVMSAAVGGGLVYLVPNAKAKTE